MRVEGNGGSAIDLHSTKRLFASRSMREEARVVITGAVCMSHSPLMDRNRADPSVEQKWDDAVALAGRFLAEDKPDLCVVFYPDHLNGFLYNLMPAFCVGAAGKSLGDFGTVPGTMDIPEDLAADCAAYCLAHDIDVALSYAMDIDHGAAQPVEALAAHGVTTRFIPIFINCAAPPRPSFSRAQALGNAVGEWARSRTERIAFVGSGGLSHDPPTPKIGEAVGSVAERLRGGTALSHADRLARQHRVHREGKTFPSNSALRPLAPEWDRSVMEAYRSGRIDLLHAIDDEALTAKGGSGSHELRCWVAALSAVSPGQSFEAESLFYEAVDPWITGMGVMTARPSAQ